MTGLIEVLKDPDNERPVPTIWRNTLSNVVDALRRKDFALSGIENTDPLPPDEADRISRNIVAYGAHLAQLPERAWQTSVCRWMEGYWDVLIDLFTEESGESDLVLFVRVYEEGNSYRFTVESVHVP